MGENNAGSGMPAAGFRAGHVLWMPRGATWMNRDKPRPFALAASFRNEVTLVYGSTQQTERNSGAACAIVAPRPMGVNRNGLRMPTLFYPTLLVLASAAGLPSPSGYLGRSLDALRAALRMALGIGQGSCLRAGAPAGSLRGRIVVLNAAAARSLDTELAVVLTEHRYSAERRYEVILPVLHGAAGPAREHELVIRSGDWLAALSQPATAAVLPIPIILSLWYSPGVIHETEHVLDEDTLARVDRELCRFFSLPEGVTDGR